VEKIHAPVLRQLIIIFFLVPPFAVPRLYEFITRSQWLKDARRATMELYPSHFSMTDESGDRKIYLGSPVLVQTISPMAQLCNNFSPLLSQVKFLEISSRSRLSQDDMDPAPWREILRSFVYVESLILSEYVVAVVARVLREVTERRMIEVLPVLRNLVFENPGLSRSIREVIQVFLDARQLSGRPVALIS
jgi:hypothetical protein